MTNPHTIAAAIRDVIATWPDVAEAHTGALVAISSSPVAEVLVEDGRVSHLPAGGPGETLEAHSIAVLFLVAMTPNSEADEATAAELAHRLMTTVNAAAFDDTLGGLVERTRATAYRFDITRRNQRPYRVAAVRIETGEV